MQAMVLMLYYQISVLVLRQLQFIYLLTCSRQKIIMEMIDLIDGGIAANNPALLAMRPTGAKANLLPENVLDLWQDDYLSGDVSSTD
uniref:Uncharacterized protein n=1 Tax=Solanum lycopersicum TaxID=4081 RepID=A0A3Q7FY68_SOLLC